MGTVRHTQQYVEILYATGWNEHIVSSSLTLTVACDVSSQCVYGKSASVDAAVSADAVGWLYDVFERATDVSIAVDTSADMLAIFDRAEEIALEVAATAQGQKIIPATASAILVLDTSADVQCVFSRGCEVEVQSTTLELDTETYEMVTVIEGLDCSAAASRPITVSAYQPVTVGASASKVLIHPDAIDVSATAEVVIGCAAAKNEYGAGLAWVLLTASATVDKCAPVDANIDVSAEADVSLVASPTAEAAVSLELGVTYVVESACIACEYHPFVGAGSEDAPTPPPTSLTAPLDVTDAFKLVYPATGAVTDSVILRAPQMGNRDRLGFNRINRNTRGGTLIVYADPMWPKTQTLVLNFAGLTATESTDLLTFLETYLGAEIGLLDWEHRFWRGIVTQPDAVIQDGRDSYSASFEFEGELDPSWTP